MQHVNLPLRNNEFKKWGQSMSGAPGKEIQRDNSKTIGFEIPEVSHPWTDLIQHLPVKEMEGHWGGFDLATQGLLPRAPFTLKPSIPSPHCLQTLIF